MPDEAPLTVDPLALVSDKELINALRKRGHACVIAMARKDEGDEHGVWQIAYSQGGDLGHCLGLCSALLKDTAIKVRAAGVSEDHIHQLLAEGAALRPGNDPPEPEV